MSAPSDEPTLAQFLVTHRADIVSRFVADVARKLVPEEGLPRPLLIDHIPQFIDEVAEELETASRPRVSQEIVTTSPTARRHGEQRWNLGYDLEGLVREYGVLRRAILDAAHDARLGISIAEFDVLARCLNVGVAEAATAYAEYRDDQSRVQRENLEFLAHAGEVLGSSLDYRATLTALTRLVVPKLADWCAVEVQPEHEGDARDDLCVLHRDPDKSGLVKHLIQDHPLPETHPLSHARVLKTGESQLIELYRLSPREQTPIQRELLQTLGTRSVMIHPLRVHGQSLGSVIFAYGDSDRHYAQDDLTLTGELARRAGTAIDNSRLYALSQSERARVEAATRAKDEFVAMISHELRTPMHAILGWLRLMKEGALAEERYEHALNVIERNAKAQNRLIDDLLDISKILSGRVRINPSQVDLCDVVEMALEGVRPAADAKRIQLEPDLDRTNSVVRADGERMQQVAWNLLSNAVKFTPKGGRVKVSLRRVESDLELTVEDSGEGIAPEFLPHMFETFRQSDSATTRPHGGLGIGLSIAKYLVELHGGTIRGRSEGLGEGATFIVRIPVSPLVSATLGISSALTARPSDLPPRPSLPGVRALVVDDDPDSLDLVRYFLEDCGAIVQTASSAAEALDTLRQHPIDVLISDIGMPGEDGYSLIRGVRALSDATKNRVPAIALTAFTRNADRNRALVSGFNRHMTKPVEAIALVGAVAELMESQEPAD